VSNIVNQSNKEYAGVGVLVDSVCRSLDPKNRLTISAGWREVMRQPDYVYLMPGRKDDAVKCVDLIPPQVFDSLFKSLQGMSRKDPRWKSVNLICNSSSQVYLDIQGRIRIPDKFLAFAGLESKVVMSGAHDRIKIYADDGSEGSTEIDFDAFDAACNDVDL
jgi:division/cell wall cluster transcriptional repressor MraZ